MNTEGGIEVRGETTCSSQGGIPSDLTSDSKTLEQIEAETGKTIYELFAGMFLAHRMVNEDVGWTGKPAPCLSAPMHHDMCKHYRNDNRCLLIAPAKFAKSTWSSFFQPLTDGVLGLVNGDILLISNTGSLAEDWLRLIKEEIEHNQDILDTFGDLKGGIWRNDQIKLKTGIRIVSLGWSHQIRGTGWGKVVGDDMENDEMMRSEDQREKFSDWWDGAMMGRMQPHTKVVLVGTFLHPLCKIKKMYDNVTGQYDNWVRMKYQALDENGQSTWPDRWPMDKLIEARRELGEKKWLAEKMNDPIFGEDHIIEPTWIKRYKTRPDHFDLTITAFDSSSGQDKEVGDYAGHITFGLKYDEQHPPGDIFILAARRGRWPLYEKIKVLFDTDDLYDPRFNLIESDAYGKELKEAITREAEKVGRVFPKRLVVPDKSKARRLMRVTDLFQKGRIFFPEQGAEQVIDQLLMFSGTHEMDNDEYVDCMSMGLGFLKRQRLRSSGRKAIDRPFNRLKKSPSGRLK